MALCSEDALDRKRALHITTNAVGPGGSWRTWAMLYSQLEEYSSHLIKPAWDKVWGLCGPNCREGSEVGVEWGGRRNRCWVGVGPGVEGVRCSMGVPETRGGAFLITLGCNRP
eukprot:364306-Chlamydomonas_euryale.AAC.3